MLALLILSAVSAITVCVAESECPLDRICAESTVPRSCNAENPCFAYDRC